MRKLILTLIVSAALLPGAQAKGWEGDDGGLDQWEVSLGIYAEAVRLNNQMQLTEPPAPPAILGPLGLPIAPYWFGGCDEMEFYRQQVGLPGVFRSIGWRESNCRNEDGVRTSCCHGYWQLHHVHFNGSGYVYGRWCDARSVQDVNSDTPEDKQRQACAAKALYDRSGESPWGL